MAVRHAVKQQTQAAASMPRKPMAEGLQKHAFTLMEGIVITLRPNGQRDWDSISQANLVAYGRHMMKKTGLTYVGGLLNIDAGAYHALRNRGLLKHFRQKPKARVWRNMSAPDLIDYAQGFVNRRKIKNKSQLQKADYGLYKILYKRGLLDKIRFPKPQRNWKGKSDHQILVYTRKFMRREKITSKSQLAKADPGLYVVLRRRKLLHKIRFKDSRRNWKDMSDKQVVDDTRRFMKEEGITTRTGLSDADPGRYCTLKNRKLLDAVFSGHQ